jgi:hypothetical protein
MDYTPFDPTIKRTEATIKHKTTGEAFKVSKAGLARTCPRHVIQCIFNPHFLSSVAASDVGFRV